MPKKKLYLVAVDGSEWSERATQRAVNLAKETDSTVELVTVIPWSGYQPITLEELSLRPMVKEQEEAHAHEAILKPLLDKHQDSGVEISTAFDWGNPVKVIANIAKKKRANMVFVGRRGRSRISDLIIGSVANALAHSLGVPIVLVP
ncbi:universal stress protein [Kordiimonas aquimaris]|uniref:universal stress protein n=1 Tax=Kordiimonas aquimaris TaxID=707591 RepID=UPI0021CE0D26|nr:universal stress protein [Kordiimonas aquimaris]